MSLLTGLTIQNGMSFQTAPSDQYFNYVTYLLPGTGANNATNNTFIDSSANNFPVTVNGATTSQGSFSPYDVAWSNYFDGSGDYLRITSNAAFGLGTGDFTVECWIYLLANAVSGGSTIVDFRTSVGSTPWNWFLKNTGSGNFMGAFTGANVEAQSTFIPLFTWTHLAISRTSSIWELFVNGVPQTLTGSGYDANLGSSNPISICADASGASALKCHLSNLRIVKGTSVYSGNFTPPISSLTAVTNTQLLTCQSNRFVDNSTNNFTITKTGEVYSTAFNPFNPSSVYNSAITGGSLNLNGSSDFLSLAASSQFAITTSTTPFTVEAWIYPLVAGGVIFSEGYFGGVDTVTVALSLTNGTGVDIVTGLIVGFGWFNGTAWTTAALANSAVPLNAWTHVAAVFTGSTTKIYYNGVDVTKTSTPTPATTWGVTGDNGDTWYVGRRWDTSPPAYYYGYLSDIRFVIGTAVYTGNFSVPTSPLTAITNTRLLLNCNNAVIVDSATINDVATVTNAAISTVQSKFGNGSIYLNGGSYLRSQWTPSYFMGGTFTIEMWAYLTVNPNGGALIAEYYDGSADTTVIYTIGFGSSLGATTGSNIYFGCFNGSSWSGVTTGTSLTLNTWNHVAVSSVASTVTIYINGVSVGSGSVTLPTTFGVYLHVGKRWDNNGSPYITGYLNDVRVTNGIARYTANFTPPTTAFPNR